MTFIPSGLPIRANASGLGAESEANSAKNRSIPAGMNITRIRLATDLERQQSAYGSLDCRSLAWTHDDGLVPVHHLVSNQLLNRSGSRLPPRA